MELVELTLHKPCERARSESSRGASSAWQRTLQNEKTTPMGHGHGPLLVGHPNRAHDSGNQAKCFGHWTFFVYPNLDLNTGLPNPVRWQKQSPLGSSRPHPPLTFWSCGKKGADFWQTPKDERAHVCMPRARSTLSACSGFRPSPGRLTRVFWSTGMGWPLTLSFGQQKIAWKTTR